MTRWLTANTDAVTETKIFISFCILYFVFFFVCFWLTGQSGMIQKPTSLHLRDSKENEDWKKSKQSKNQVSRVVCFSFFSALISSGFRQMGVSRWTPAGQSGQKQTGRRRNRMTGWRTRQYVAMATTCNGLVHMEYPHIYSIYFLFFFFLVFLFTVKWKLYLIKWPVSPFLLKTPPVSVSLYRAHTPRMP